MKHNIYSTFSISTLLLSACLSMGWSERTHAVETIDSDAARAETLARLLKVHKSPTCGCCVDWIDHVEENGFSSQVFHPEDMGALKAFLTIEPRYQSCHTAVSEQGYVFEGHVPARLVRKFLQETPDGAIGLAVPGMPMGSPGMEMGDRFNPYRVMLLKEDGSSEIYAEITSKEQQY